MLLVNERAKESVTKETTETQTWLMMAVFMSVLWDKISDLFPLTVCRCSVSVTHWQNTLYVHSLKSLKLQHPITSSLLKHLPSVFAATDNPQYSIWGGTLVSQRSSFQRKTRNVCMFFQVIKAWFSMDFASRHLWDYTRRRCWQKGKLNILLALQKENLPKLQNKQEKMQFKNIRKKKGGLMGNISS